MTTTVSEKRTIRSSEPASLREDQTFFGKAGVAHHWAVIYHGELVDAALALRGIIELIDQELLSQSR